MAVNLSPVGGVAAQFFDNSGNVLTGGKLYTYAAGTTTPQITYTTSAGNIAWSNPIILDAAGRVSGSGEIWLIDGSQYKFILRDSNDVLIATYDNVTGINSNFVNFTNSQEIQVATVGQTVFNLNTMQYQPGTNSLSVFVDGVNQYGPGAQYAYVETDADTVTFTNGLHVGAEVKFTTSQLNTSGAVDALQVSYTPPFTGAVATNVGDVLSQTISVTDFGAVGDGVTDDTAAINLAISYANANAGNIAIMFPKGDYLVSAGLNPIISNQVYFVAEAPNVAQIIGPSTVHTLLRWGDDAQLQITGGGVINVGLTWPIAPALGSVAIDLRNLTDWRLEGSRINRCGQLLRCGNAAITPVSIIYVRNITGFVANSGIPAIDLRYGAGFFANNVQLYVEGVPIPISPAPLSVVAGTHFLVANTGSWDTVELTNLLIERFDNAILFAPSITFVINNVWITASIFDYCNAGLRIVPVGGSVASIQADNSWFVGWDTHSLEMAGTGVSALHQFSNCKFFLSGNAAVDVTSIATNWLMADCEIYAANRKGSGGAALSVATGTVGFQITGCAVNFDTTSLGLPFSAPYGIAIGVDCDDYIVANNRVFGSTAAFDVGGNTGSSANRIIKLNRVASYAGKKTTGIFALPASNTPWVNTTPHDVEVSIYGGTVSGIAKNGSNMTGMTSGTLIAQPGDSITVTYSVAPNMLFYVLS